jgi:hypothetical protein
VIGPTTAEELWDLLTSRFKSKSSDRTASLHQRLTSATQRAGEKMPEFLARIEVIVRELKEGCDETVSDSMVVGILLNGVSSVCNETINALRCLDSLKLDELKQKLIAAEERMSEARESDETKAQSYSAGSSGKPKGPE